MQKIIQGNIVDVVSKRIFQGILIIENQKIIDIQEKKLDDKNANFIIPGFIDSHIHIESSMLLPSEFAKVVAKHGTVGVVTDPHEIANVSGIKGIEYMVDDAKNSMIHFAFGVPSCVPATPFEESGAKLTSSDVENLIKKDEFYCLSEMMNVPGVINQDKEVIKKINSAKKYNKPIDGHAPLLLGDELKKYINAGISTDHECSNMDEAREKAFLGMKIIIREGSAAKNFDDIIEIIKEFPEKCMFCSDDKHPDDLVKGHINSLVKRAIKKGYDLFDVLRASSFNPIKHYNLKIGLLQKGDDADFIVVDNLSDFNVLKTYIKGEDVLLKNFENQEKKIEYINNFVAQKILPDAISVKKESGELRVIKLIENQLITSQIFATPLEENGNVISDVQKDILKIVLYNRYQNTKPVTAFVNGIGLKKGAFATSVSHDNHNIIAVGAGDDDIVEAINLIVENKGGLSFVCGDNKEIIPLPIAGLISDLSAKEIADKYTNINQVVKDAGVMVEAPFMILSFMALIVIPELKIGNKGLFLSSECGFVSNWKI